MDDAKALWKRWQALIRRFSLWFTHPGWVRFTQWVTGMVLCWEEHTITQILTAMNLESRWRVLEHFAEYGSFDCEAVERCTIRLIEEQQPARLAGYHPVALDDTKEHRTSADVGGKNADRRSKGCHPRGNLRYEYAHWLLAPLRPTPLRKHLNAPRR